MRWLFVWFVKLTAWIPQLFAFKKKVYYQDKKIQKRHIKGKAIVVCNHHAIMDFALMMFVFYTRTLRCQVSEIVYEKNFALKTLLKGLGAIKVERTTHDFSFMEKSMKILEKGGVVEVFPEARLPLPGEEKPLPFKPSVVKLALDTDTKIIPVYSNGVYFKNKRCRVVIGTPFNVRELYDQTKTEKENLSIITEKLREKVISLENEIPKSKKEKKRV